MNDVVHKETIGSNARSRLNKAFTRGMSPLWAAGALALAVLASGCDQPIAVEMNVVGAKDLNLRGIHGITGTITRSLVFDGKTFAKGSKVVVNETFLVRREGGKPPSYHFKGLYDPVKRADGFMLPSGTIDTYYLSVLEPDRRQRVPVPKEYFKPDREP